MRMRNKPWAAPELNACPFFVRRPEDLAGGWHGWFPRRQPLHLELGCGKGWFLAGLAPENPDINYLGIDMKDIVLAPGKRVIEQAFGDRPVDNVALTAHNVEQLTAMMNERDQAARIYVNFCNPWPKPKHHKRRLTHPRRLADYRTLLAPGGELWFKTDNDELFEATLGYLEECGWRLLWQTRDLHGETDPRFFPGKEPRSILTEHEKMFLEQGIPIKALAATAPASAPAEG